MYTNMTAYWAAFSRLAIDVVSSKSHVLDDVIDQPFNAGEGLPFSFSITATVTAKMAVGPR